MGVDAIVGLVAVPFRVETNKNKDVFERRMLTRSGLYTGKGLTSGCCA